MSSVVIINPFLFPQHKSLHGSFILRARTGFQKQFQLKNKVLFFNFPAICIRVSVVYLASTLVFTYVFKAKNGLVWFMDCSKSAIFYVVHLIWEGMEKGHNGHTNTRALPPRVGGYSFSLKKMSVRSDLWYAEHTELHCIFDLGLVLFGPKRIREWNHFSPKIFSLITPWYNRTTLRLPLFRCVMPCPPPPINKNQNKQPNERRNRDAVRCKNQCHASEL